MNNDPYAPGPSLHIPFTLLAIAIAVLLGAQIGAAKKSAEIMVWQRDTLEKQITNMQAADKQLAEAVTKRETLVKQSTELQNQLQTLLNDLLDLAKEDPDAKQIIEKWKISRAQPPAANPEEKPAEEKKAP